MIKVVLFAATGLFIVSAAPEGHAGDKVRLVGGCPSIADRPDCPSAPPPGPPPPPGGYPVGAQPGQCFAQVRTPPLFESYTEQTVVSAGRVERHFAPAQYEWSERQVLIRPERAIRHVIPATYRTVTETVVIQPASVRVEHSPPVYDTVADRVLVHAAHTEWRRTFVGPNGVLPPGARVEPTGEVVCLVEVPAEYATVQRQVLRDPGHEVQIPVPAVTREVSRQVIDQPEHVDYERIPAEYGAEKVRRLARPAHTETVRVPPVFSSQVKQRLVSPGGLEWRQVDCDSKGAPPPPR